VGSLSGGRKSADLLSESGRTSYRRQSRGRSTFWLSVVGLRRTLKAPSTTDVNYTWDLRRVEVQAGQDDISTGVRLNFHHWPQGTTSVPILGWEMTVLYPGKPLLEAIQGRLSGTGRRCSSVPTTATRSLFTGRDCDLSSAGLCCVTGRDLTGGSRRIQVDDGLDSEFQVLRIFIEPLRRSKPGSSSVPMQNYEAGSWTGEQPVEGKAGYLSVGLTPQRRRNGAAPQEDSDMQGGRSGDWYQVDEDRFYWYRAAQTT